MTRRTLSFKRVLGLFTAAAVLSVLTFGFLSLRTWFQQAFPVAGFAGGLKQHANDAWKVRIDFDSIDYEPGWPVRVRLDQLVVRDAQTQELLLQAERASIPLGLPRLERRELPLKPVQLHGAVLHIRRNFQGRWNWELMKRAGPSKAVFRRFGRDWTLVFEGLTAGPESQVRYADWTLQPTFFYSVRGAGLSFLPDRSGGGMVMDARGPGFVLAGFYDWQRDAGRFNFHDQGRTLSLQAEVEELSIRPRFQYAVELKGARHAFLKKWLQGAGFEGDLTMKAEGMAAGVTPKEWMDSLFMNGALDLRQGSYGHNHLGVEVMDKLGIPAEPGQEVQGKTPFRIFQSEVHVSQGVLRLGNIRMQDSGFMIEADGLINIRQQDADISAKLVWSEHESQKWFRREPKLESLLNNKGRIALPFALRGLLPAPSVAMDPSLISAAGYPYEKFEPAR